ncbi:hypothetical protein SAMN06265365_1706 [Tistlia consotensis]|uniref:Uncharacterized protein n=1 Tax=Tistlia consotensis USBA 355 TaxID=560819 RepID=A0A1Y6CRF7_9PROT|nr:hypothetical protein [Tistlia consotensis]SMF85669.1 hypothetical protein SAMN05428998_1686 [Tistlia consotensis USBA 355]SNS40867.1 hypothetical protein SAMN06265365_1706 [Tistlia consotensis]
MATTVDTRVTPALHEATIKELEGYDEETAVYVAPVEEAFSDARITLGKLHDAKAAAASNEAWTEAQRVLLVSKEADKQQERLCKKFDAVHTALKKQVEHIDQQLSQPLKEKAGMGSLNGEVRAYAKALSREDRTKMVEQAFAAGDTDTLHALLGAQHFLSGFIPEEHAFYVRKFHEMQNPALVKRLTVTRAAMRAVEERAPLIFPQIDKVLGMRRDKVKAIAKQNEDALAALKFGAQ